MIGVYESLCPCGLVLLTGLVPGCHSCSGLVLLCLLGLSLSPRPDSSFSREGLDAPGGQLEDRGCLQPSCRPSPSHELARLLCLAPLFPLSCMELGTQHGWHSTRVPCGILLEAASCMGSCFLCPQSITNAPRVGHRASMHGALPSPVHCGLVVCFPAGPCNLGLWVGHLLGLISPSY